MKERSGGGGGGWTRPGCLHRAPAAATGEGGGLLGARGPGRRGVGRETAGARVPVWLYGEQSFTIALSGPCQSGRPVNQLRPGKPPPHGALFFPKRVCECGASSAASVGSCQPAPHPRSGEAPRPSGSLNAKPWPVCGGAGQGCGSRVEAGAWGPAGRGDRSKGQHGGFRQRLFRRVVGRSSFHRAGSVCGSLALPGARASSVLADARALGHALDEAGRPAGRKMLRCHSTAWWSTRGNGVLSDSCSLSRQRLPAETWALRAVQTRFPLCRVLPVLPWGQTADRCAPPRRISSSQHQPWEQNVMNRHPP
nr:uncharacterized protein LOC103350098 [Oryctolagus cuniculus]